MSTKRNDHIRERGSAIPSRRKVLVTGLHLAAASVVAGLVACTPAQNATAPTQNATTPAQNATTPAQNATAPTQNATAPTQNATSASAREHPVPQELKIIPEEYYQAADQQGTLTDLYYDTYESFSYTEKSEPLQKHAVVYLPYGYSKDQKYDVFYLMHGGGGDETMTLGTPKSPSSFKNVIDHAVAAGTLFYCPHPYISALHLLPGANACRQASEALHPESRPMRRSHDSTAGPTLGSPSCTFSPCTARPPPMVAPGHDAV